VRREPSRRRLSLSILVSLVLAAAPSVHGEEEEEAVRVFRTLKPSVVSLRNGEGSGTGIVLDASGAILTNAHVVSSPLRFTAELESGGAPAGGTVTFQKVEVVGFHPTLDLALLRIAPAERGVSLTAARLAVGPPSTGQRVYALGDPGSGEAVLKRTITAGLLSATDRLFEGHRYLQFTAPINPGNSGGPLADKTGAVLGLVTIKILGADRVGLAIPLAGVDVTRFVPFVMRTANPERARALRVDAEKFARTAERFDSEDERRLMLTSQAASLYRIALSHDPANAEIYRDIGLLLHRLGVKAAPAAYLLRAVQSAPWAGADGRAYGELGQALLQDGKRTQARTAWLEGLAKHPYAGPLYELLALQSMEDKRHSDAGYEATAATRVSGAQERYFQLRQLRDAARAQLNSADLTSFQQREAAMAETLRAAQWTSDTARAAKKLYLTPEFTELVRDMGGPEFPGAAATIMPRGHSGSR
jgi:Tfp pilus assembly protein PilF